MLARSNDFAEKQTLLERVRISEHYTQSAHPNGLYQTWTTARLMA